MKFPEIDEDTLEESPLLFREPSLIFDEHQSPSEGNKSKRKGLLGNGPFDKNIEARDFEKINIIPVVVEDDEVSEALKSVLMKLKQNIWKTDEGFQGFNDIFQCEIDYLDEQNWYYADRYSREEFESIAKEIRENYNFRNGDERNIVVYVTESSSANKKDIPKSEYIGMKSQLLKGFLPSQSLSEDYKKIIDQEKKGNLSEFSLLNIAAQIYAKVGGVPWTAEKPENDVSAEINVGIRASVPKTGDSNYVYGVAQIFSEHGKWIDAVVEQGSKPLKSDSYGMPSETMQELLDVSVSKYASSVLANSAIEEVKRINIHKPDGFSDSEIAAVKEYSEKNDVDICLVDVTRSDIRMYSEDEKDSNIRRGYFKRINDNTGILCTTGNYEDGGQIRSHRIGTPVPLIINVVSDEGLVTPDVEEVAKNIFDMTRLNLDDVVNKEVSHPVTLNYAHRVSSMASYGIEVHNINESVPWFL
ncbi:MAG: Piwi domain-containing protein [Candidatus Nanohaloarchaea archaeon]